MKMLFVNVVLFSYYHENSKIKSDYDKYTFDSHKIMIHATYLFFLTSASSQTYGAVCREFLCILIRYV